MSDYFKDYTGAMLAEYILDVKKTHGSRIIMPAHHYIREEIVDLADFVGDSYKLAVDVSRTDAEFIVFCGVRFMADGASVLASENQYVLLPELTAGCPMADMINEDSASKAFDAISKSCKRPPAPVVYMNSYTDAKSFCGKNGGSVCTSSNAEKIIKHYLEKGMSIFFFPDFHLGNNVARTLGIDEDKIVKVNRDITFDDPSRVKDGTIFLWDGYCPVHQKFDEADVEAVRKKYKNVNIIVHPESRAGVVELSDSYGSTQKIFNDIKNSEEGSVWAVGTEVNFVNRANRDFKGITVIPLKNAPCMDMERITLHNTALTMKSVDDFISGKGKLRNEITVDQSVRDDSRVALEKMIDIAEG